MDTQKEDDVNVIVMELHSSVLILFKLQIEGIFMALLTINILQLFYTLKHARSLH